MYSELAIKEAVDIVVGDVGKKSKEVIEILRLLKKENQEKNDVHIL